MSGRRLALVGVVAIVLLAGAGAIGWAIGRETESQRAVIRAGPPARAGHAGGANIDPREIGDQARGQQLFSQKGCATCHSYAGRGGEDAPPLDFMRGHLSATEIALMSGTIWNHTPAMVHHFEDEGVPFPTFSRTEMADLIAFLHGGPPGGP